MPPEPLKSVGRNVGANLPRSAKTAQFRHFPLDDGDPYGSRTVGSGPLPAGPPLAPALPRANVRDRVGSGMAASRSLRRDSCRPGLGACDDR